MLKLLKLVQIHIVAFVAFVDSSLNSDLQRNICLFRLQKKTNLDPLPPIRFDGWRVGFWPRQNGDYTLRFGPTSILFWHFWYILKERCNAWYKQIRELLRNVVCTFVLIAGSVHNCAGKHDEHPSSGVRNSTTSGCDSPKLVVCLYLLPMCRQTQFRHSKLRWANSQKFRLYMLLRHQVCCTCVHNKHVMSQVGTVADSTGSPQTTIDQIRESMVCAYVCSTSSEHMCACPSGQHERASVVVFRALAEQTVHWGCVTRIPPPGDLICFFRIKIIRFFSKISDFSDFFRLF